ncbi:hypothetical protein BK643_23600 [Pseudomonas protegens]|nr:hypothetical protein BK643_23600 [Pseudomonas protegens]
MRTGLQDHEFPEMYRRLLTLFPDKPWLKRVANLQHQVNETYVTDICVCKIMSSLQAVDKLVAAYLIEVAIS